MTRRTALLFSITAMVVLSACSSEQPQAHMNKNTMQQEAQKKVMAGEYIVTLGKSVCIEDIKQQFSAYGPNVIEDLGRGRYLIHLEQDPGLDALKKINCFKASTCKIQHNFKYKAFGKTGDQNELPLLNRGY